MLKSRKKPSGELRIDVALSQIDVIIVYIFSPIVAVLGDAYLKPWFHVAIVVYDGCPLNLPLVDTWIVTKPKNMPRSIQDVSPFPKCYESRW